jgi:ketosteroid isomerase-like protein
MRSAILRRAARIAFEAWHRADFALVPKIDDPAVETYMTHGSEVPVGMDRVYYGPKGHCRAMEAWNEAWREWTADIDQVIDEGRDQVVVVARIHGEAAASGVRLKEWVAVRYSFREGRIVRVEGALHPERDGALEAMDLRE